MNLVSWQINIGQMIEIIALLGGYAIIGLTMGGRVKQLELEVKKLADVLTALAVQHQRLDRLEQDLRELRHGHGYVIQGG